MGPFLFFAAPLQFPLTWEQTPLMTLFKCPGILNELLGCRILINSAALPLLAKKIFDRILAQPITQKNGHTRNSEDIPHQLDKRVN